MYDYLGVEDGDVIADISILQLSLSWADLLIFFFERGI